MQITLNDEERRALVELLEECLPELREEVYKTERFEYRERLKTRKAMMIELLDRLRTAA